MTDDLLQRLRDTCVDYDGSQMPAVAELRNVSCGLLREAADEIERLRRERDAAFSLSRCECGTDECCRNLVASITRAESAERERDEARAERDALRERFEAAPVVVLDNSAVLGEGARIHAIGGDRYDAPDELCGKRVRLVEDGP